MAAALTPGRAWRARYEKRTRGMREQKRWPCRCTACGARRTLRKHPDDYIRRPPRCRYGCRIRDAQGRTLRFAPLRIDWWRIAKEWGARPCYWCGGYSFPHARGRGYCEHNPKLTMQMRQDREEERRWA